MGYKDRIVIVDGKWHYIQEMNGGGGIFAFLIVLGVVWWLYTQMVLTFSFPNEEDFKSDIYLKHVNSVASDYILKRDRQIWVNQGFVTDTGPRTYKIDEGYALKSKRVEELTKYFGQGLYQVYTSSDVTLSSTSEDKKTTKEMMNITNEYIVTLKANPVRRWYGAIDLRWDIQDIKLVKSSQKPAEVIAALRNWKVPPNIKPSW